MELEATTSTAKTAMSAVLTETPSVELEATTSTAETATSAATTGTATAATGLLVGKTMMVEKRMAQGLCHTEVSRKTRVELCPWRMWM